MFAGEVIQPHVKQLTVLTLFELFNGQFGIVKGHKCILQCTGNSIRNTVSVTVFSCIFVIYSIME